MYDYGDGVTNYFISPLRDRPIQRLTRCVGGLALFGIGVGMQKQGHMGLAPWDVFHDGLSKQLNWPFGRALILTSFLVLFLWIPLRQKPGIGTLLNAVEIGLVAGIVIEVLPRAESLPLRIALMLGGIVILGIGSGLYIGAGLGPGPRDGLFTGLAERGFTVSRARTIVEISVLVVGFALGGAVGVGTLVFAFGIGPIVARTLPLLHLAPLEAATEEEQWGE
jgi:uncharacterized membrane protein YczE